MNAAKATQEALIDLYARELRLPGLRKAYRELARDAAQNGQDHLAYLAACLTAEVESRRQSRLNSRLGMARFPVLKTLESFDFTALPDLPKARVLQLADASFVKARENVICLGPTGTGKTHTAIALGVAVIHAGCRVRFTTAVALGQELLQAHTEARLPKALKTWDRFDLVILDELGYLGLGPAGPLLFQFCAHRYERGSLLITTNLEFSRWVEVFGDAALTSALLDRLTHRSQVLLFNGESYRFRESQQRLRKEGVSP